MTEKQIENIRNKITASRERLLETAPEMALLLMHIRYVAVEKMKGISTNGRCIYFDAKLMESLEDFEIDFILCHILMHILNRDIDKPRDLVTDSYHFACDVTNNDRLFAIYGFSIVKLPHLGTVHHMIPWYMTSGRKLSPEKIYDRLPPAYKEGYLKDGSKILLDNSSWWWMKDNAGIGPGLTMILDVPQTDGFVPVLPGGGNNSGEPNNQYWHSLLSSMFEVNRSATDSDANDGNKTIDRLIRDKESNQIDWRKILHDFIQEEVYDYSFVPPDKRFNDSIFFLPDFNEKLDSVKDVLFMVDTSGSIKDEMIDVAYAEISNAIDQFNGQLSGYIGFFDDKVYSVNAFTNKSELKSFNAKGGGWTDFSPIFEHVRTKLSDRNISSLIILTDGYGEYPEAFDINNIPVLWLINNDDAQPPFGKTVRFKISFLRN